MRFIHRSVLLHPVISLLIIIVVVSGFVEDESDAVVVLGDVSTEKQTDKFL